MVRETVGISVFFKVAAACLYVVVEMKNSTNQGELKVALSA